MPMLTTALTPGSARSRSASSAARPVCAEARRASSVESPERSAVCRTLRPSVTFTVSPRSIASRFSSTPAVRARSTSADSNSSVRCCIEKSAHMCPCANENRAARPGSVANASARVGTRPAARSIRLVSDVSACRATRLTLLGALPRGAGIGEGPEAGRDRTCRHNLECIPREERRNAEGYRIPLPVRDGNTE